MSILTKHVLREYLKLFFLTLAVLILIYHVIDLIEKTRIFSRHHFSASLIVQYFLYKFPKMIFDLLPLSALLTTLVTLGTFSRDNEVTAWQSVGVSPFRLTLPLLVFGIFLSLTVYLLNGALVPLSYQRAEAIRQNKIFKKNRTVVQNQLWFQLGHQRFFHVQMIDPDQTKMEGVALYFLADDFSVSRQIEAKSLVYEKKEWVFMEGVEKIFKDQSVAASLFDRKTILLGQTPDDFNASAINPDEMTYRGLTDSINRLSKNGLDSTRYRVYRHGKRAFPWVNFLMILIGIPFSIQRGPSAPLGRGVAISLTIGFSYWILYSLGMTLGYAKVVSPWIAGWGANLIFLGLGVGLLMNMKRR